MSSKNNWQHKEERGSLLGMKFLFFFLKIFGTRMCRLVSWPIVVYFYLSGGAARKASRRYLDRVENTKADGASLSGFRHFLTYTHLLIDRINIWSGGKLPKIHWHGQEELRKQINSEQGVVLLSAHMGSIELLRAFRSQLGKSKMNVLMDISNARKINKIIGDSSDDKAMEIIGADQNDPSLAVNLREKVKQGEIICCMADRILAGSQSRTRALPFLDSEAPFPEGAFILAALMKTPVYMVSCYLENNNSYTVRFKPLSIKTTVKRADRAEHMNTMMSAYAEELSSHCLEFPYQWGNFYDFWAADSNE